MSKRFKKSKFPTCTAVASSITIMTCDGNLLSIRLSIAFRSCGKEVMTLKKYHLNLLLDYKNNYCI